MGEDLQGRGPHTDRLRLCPGAGAASSARGGGGGILSMDRGPPRRKLHPWKAALFILYTDTCGPRKECGVSCVVLRGLLTCRKDGFVDTGAPVRRSASSGLTAKPATPHGGCRSETQTGSPPTKALGHGSTKSPKTPAREAAGHPSPVAIMSLSRLDARTGSCGSRNTGCL